MFVFSIVPTLHLQRSDRHSRWICAREALLLQGIPIYKSLSYGKVLCSFAKDDSRILYTGRTATIGQAGNAMHSQCASIALLYCLTQIDLKKGAMSVPASDTPNRLTSSASSDPTISQPPPSRVNERKRDLADDTNSIDLTDPGPCTGAASAARKYPPSTTSIAQMMWACSARAPKRTK